MTTAMPHAILLGDSIFDNASYVQGGSPVIEQLQARLPREWRTTLLACDGAFTSGIALQLERLPADATHLVISVGGNDALGCCALLRSPMSSEELLDELIGVQDRFRSDYRQMLDAIGQTGLPALACTVYDAVPRLLASERMALSLFQDVIQQELHKARLPILELREVCTEPSDYSDVSPIEPSEIGGDKIARALRQILTSHDFNRGETVVYP